MVLGLGACSKPASAPPAPQPSAPPPAPAEPAAFERLQKLETIQQLSHPTGRPRLLHFWALWCAACVEELPRLVPLFRQAKAAGAEVVLVDADGFEKEAEVRAHLSQLGALDAARHAMLDMTIDAERVTALFEGSWHGDLPATFVYRPSGERAFSAIGPLTPDQERELLRALSR